MIWIINLTNLTLTKKPVLCQKPRISAKNQRFNVSYLVGCRLLRIPNRQKYQTTNYKKEE